MHLHLYSKMLRTTTFANTARAGLRTFGAAAKPSIPKRFNSTAKPTVVEIRDLKQFAQVTNNQAPAFIDFYATWCGPCKAIAPVFDKLAEKVPEAAFGRVDVDIANDVAAAHQITAMPTIALFKEGKELERIVGADLQRLVNLIKEHTGNDPLKRN